MSANQPPKKNSRRSAMMAVVLGSALAALGTADVARASEPSPHALNNISRYCSACWRNARLPIDRWNDCTQEVFRRLLERVPTAGWGAVLANETEERREFLRAIDTVKKRHQRDRARFSGLEGVVPDHRDVRDRRDGETREELRRAADTVLSARQRHIVRMTSEGHAVADIASALSMSPERVSDEKYKAIRKLREHFGTEPRA